MVHEAHKAVIIGSSPAFVTIKTLSVWKAMGNQLMKSTSLDKLRALLVASGGSFPLLIYTWKKQALLVYTWLPETFLSTNVQTVRIYLPLSRKHFLTIERAFQHDFIYLYWNENSFDHEAKSERFYSEIVGMDKASPALSS